MESIVTMPKLSGKMEKGMIVSWVKKVGDNVKKGEVLFEVETEKVVSEIEASASGRLERIMFDAGNEVSVNHPVAVIKS